MVRYKRRRKYKSSTRVVKMRFQSFMDISTNASSMQVITISAGGKDILTRLSPQFAAYKYYKIGKISVKLVPASTLPVDPTGLSIASGDNLVDPRDQLTPGLMRITNGEDVFENISGLTDAQQHGIYNNMLLDPRWYKWMLQSGVKRFAYPRYWQIGQLHQDKWPGAFMNYPVTDASNQLVGTNNLGGEFVNGQTGLQTTVTAGSSAYGFFQTGHRGVLGWLPTDSCSPIAGESDSYATIASPPEIEVMKIILPKAYKTRYWYRAFITEEVLFKEPIVNFGVYADDGYLYRPLDIFHQPANSAPQLPYTANQGLGYTDARTGGNYGDH